MRGAFDSIFLARFIRTKKHCIIHEHAILVPLKACAVTESVLRWGYSVCALYACAFFTLENVCTLHDSISKFPYIICSSWFQPLIRYCRLFRYIIFVNIAFALYTLFCGALLGNRIETHSHTHAHQGNSINSNCSFDTVSIHYFMLVAHIESMQVQHVTQLVSTLNGNPFRLANPFRRSNNRETKTKSDSSFPRATTI